MKMENITIYIKLKNKNCIFDILTIDICGRVSHMFNNYIENIIL